MYFSKMTNDYQLKKQYKCSGFPLTMTAIALSTTTPLLLPSPRLEYKFWCWICFWCSGMLVTSPWVYLTWWICRITITLPKGKCRYDQWSCVGTSRWQKEFLPLRNSSEGGFFFKPQLVIIVMIIIFGLFLEDIMIIITFKPWLVIILIFLLLTFITVCYKNVWER